MARQTATLLPPSGRTATSPRSDRYTPSVSLVTYDRHMARRISYPRSTSGRSQQTDWSRWADGQHHRLYRGTDFPQEPHRAARALRAWGARNGFRVHVVQSGPTTIDVRVTER